MRSERKMGPRWGGVCRSAPALAPMPGRWAHVALGLALGLLLVVTPGAALAQKSGAKKKAGATPAPVVTTEDDTKRPKKQRVFEFGAFGIEGTMRTPQLLYFLGRVKQELDRANLEKRSFLPELERSVDEGGL
jgi:hypothetical protein